MPAAIAAGNFLKEHKTTRLCHATQACALDAAQEVVGAMLKVPRWAFFFDDKPHLKLINPPNGSKPTSHKSAMCHT